MLSVLSITHERTSAEFGQDHISAFISIDGPFAGMWAYVGFLLRIDNYDNTAICTSYDDSLTGVSMGATLSIPQ